MYHTLSCTRLLALLCLALLVGGALPVGAAADAALVTALTQQLSEHDTLVRLRAVEGLAALLTPDAVPPLVQALRDVDPTVRVKVVAVLGEKGDVRAVPGLVAALDDPFVFVGAAAVTALGKITDPRATDALMALVHNRQAPLHLRAVEVIGNNTDPRLADMLLEELRDTDPVTRVQAARVLSGFLTPRAIDGLLAALDDTDATVRLAALAALKSVRDARVVTAVCRLATADGNVTVRTAALAALANADDPRVLATLVAAVRDPDAGMRLAALSGLRTHRDEAAVRATLDSLADADARVRDQARRSVARWREPRAVPLLLNALPPPAKPIDFLTLMEQGGQLDGVDFGAVQTLMDIGLPARDGVLQALRAEANPDRRILLAVALAQFTDAPSGETIATMLNDPLPRVREFATFLLAVRHDARSIPGLLALRATPALKLRETALSLLCDIDDPRVVPVMVETARDNSLNAYLRMRAIDNLGKSKSGAAHAAEVLLPLIKDEDRQIRETAATALANVPNLPLAQVLPALLNDPSEHVHAAVLPLVEQTLDPHAAPLLLPGLTAPNADVRGIALRGLGALADPQAIPALLTALQAENNDKFRRQIIDVLGTFADDDTVRALLVTTLTRDTDAFLRRRAVRALARGQAARVLPDLLAALGDTDAEVRAEAAGALGALGDKSALATLRAQYEQNSVTRAAIAKARWQLGDTEAVPLLLALLDDTDAAASTAAISALGVTGDLRGVTPLAARLAKTKPGDAWPLLEALLNLTEAHPGAAELDPLVLAVAPQLSNEDENARQQCVSLLGKAARPAAAEALIRLATDTTQPAWMREWIYAALANIRDPRVTRYLQTTLATGEAQERVYAAIALAKQDAGEALAVLLDTVDQGLGAPGYYPALLALGDIHNQRALAALLAAAEAPVVGQRDVVLQALLRLPRDRAAAAVPVVLAQWPLVTDSELRKEAVRWLGASRDPRALEPLLAALKTATIPDRLFLLAALGTLGDPRAVPPLIDLLTDPSYRVRRAAAQALAALTGKNFGLDPARWRATLPPA